MWKRNIHCRNSIFSPRVERREVKNRAPVRQIEDLSCNTYDKILDCNITYINIVILNNCSWFKKGKPKVIASIQTMVKVTINVKISSTNAKP
jgi:hypothetical protein